MLFTKKGDKVLDFFACTFTVNVVCQKLVRIGYSIEIEKKYYRIGKSLLGFRPFFQEEQHHYLGDCRDIDTFNIPTVDFMINSPPYWDQLKKKSMRQAKREIKGLDTFYSASKNNLENISDYNDFVDELVKIYRKMSNYLKEDGYMVIIINNFYRDGRIFPLAFDLANKLSDFLEFKGEQIWCQNDKSLLPLGVNNEYIGNRHHVYCLVFYNRKKILHTSCNKKKIKN